MEGKLQQLPANCDKGKQANGIEQSREKNAAARDSIKLWQNYGVILPATKLWQNYGKSAGTRAYHGIVTELRPSLAVIKLWQNYGRYMELF